MDDKAAFYLQHWQLIQEWQALRGEALNLVDDALVAIGPQLQVEVGDTAQLTGPDLTTGEVGFSLRREDWTALDCTVALTLSWHLGSLLTLDDDAYSSPYVGISVTGGTATQRRHVEERLQAGLEVEAEQLAWDYSEDGWPCYRYVQAAGEVEPQRWAQDCAEALLTGWRAMAPAVDRILAAWRVEESGVEAA